MPNSELESTYICKSYWGFRSWDDFFTQRFWDGVRPVHGPGNDNVIGAACEGETDHVSANVKKDDTLMIKGRAYTLSELLGGRDDKTTDQTTDKSTGGFIYQASIPGTNYHH
ncbi:hypothetical protein BDV12DRAFT_203647 [Aspergillus spectabilis]